jgi:site-specific recombinase XerD
MMTRYAVKEFLISRGRLRPKTIHWYANVLRRFEKAFPGELPQRPQPLQEWLNSFQHLTPETVHGYFRALRALYRQTRRWHSRVKDPMPLVNAPSIHPKVMRTFSMNELARMFTLPLSSRDRALLTFLLDTGARSGECANLTWEDITPEFAIVTGKRGERMVPLSLETYNLLLKLRLPPEDLKNHVFYSERGALSEEGVYKAVRRICARAGLVGRRCCPQTFRHTFGTEYAGTDGCDPQALQMIMGHKDDKTTKIYIHTSIKRMVDNHRKCTPLRALAAAAQGALIKEEAVQEAEEIVRQGKGG